MAERLSGKPGRKELPKAAVRECWPLDSSRATPAVAPAEKRLFITLPIYIILPQAFKRTLPPLAGQFISLIKDSLLVSVIAITNLTKRGREVVTSTFAVFEIWFVVAFLYLILTFTLSQVVAWVERRLAVSD